MIESTLLMAFIAGVQTMAFALVGLYFLRFFLRTRDNLFLAFAGAFGLMALNQALVGLLDIPREEQSPFYLLRLVAFLLIIAAVVAKNLGRGRG
jgi:hypothetical protein